jgi:glycosyltransferase involved in cell wall biosynthesis
MIEYSERQYMRILFVSNYLSHSGYARQARMIVPAIIAAGHEVEVLPIASMHINSIGYAPDGVKLLPLAQDTLGNDIVGYHYQAGKFDAVMTFTDVWGLVAEAYVNLNWYPITPIDTYTLHPQHAGNIRAAKLPIAISKFGQDVIRKETGIESKYLPMMVDTDFWKPGDKEQARQQLGIAQDAILFMFIGVNHDVPSRKGIPELLSAWAACCNELPDNAYLHMHTAKRGAIDVEAMAQQLEIPPNRLKIIDEAQYHTGLDDEMMLLMAQSSDCLIQPSRREGACLPLLEYQACGVPVIASDGQAQTEYNFGGYKVDGELSWSVLGAWEFVPNIDSVKKQILNIAEYYRQGGNSDLGIQAAQKEKSRQRLLKYHSVQAVTTKHLHPILEAIAMDVLSRE